MQSPWTISLYCREGIRRFLDGEYSWGRSEAFMIDYVRDGSTIDATLRAFLSRPSARQRYLVEDLLVAAGRGTTDFAYTRHGRNFVYANQQSPNTPGPISIWHLWLDCPERSQQRRSPQRFAARSITMGSITKLCRIRSRTDANFRCDGRVIQSKEEEQDGSSEEFQGADSTLLRVSSDLDNKPLQPERSEELNE